MKLRVKVQLTASFPSPKNPDGDYCLSAPAYEVSSALELFDRLMRMRYRSGLLSIKICRASPFSLGFDVASISPYTRPVSESSTRKAVKIIDAKLADPESLEAFAVEVWEVIESHRHGQGVNRE